MSVPEEEGVQDPYNTLRWMAPENLQSHHFSTASDVWSFGVVMWEMFDPPSLPYKECDDKVCVERITQGYVLEVPEECPERVAKILKACWYQNPASRPSFLYISSLLSSIILEYPYV
jgi:serine/threonine protein kinase